MTREKFGYFMEQKGYRWGLSAYVVAFFAFILAPILIVVVVSFSSTAYVTFPVKGYSLKWFHRFIEYRPFLDSFVVSIEIAVSGR